MAGNGTKKDNIINTKNILIKFTKNHPMVLHSNIFIIEFGLTIKF